MFALARQPRPKLMYSISWCMKYLEVTSNLKSGTQIIGHYYQ